MEESWSRSKRTKNCLIKFLSSWTLSSSLTEHRLFFQVRCCRDRIRTGPYLPCTLVDLAILACRCAPGKIAAHPVSHQRLPRGRIAVGEQCLFDGRQQLPARVIGELEARALAGARVPRLDGVIEAARRPHYR